MRFTMLRPVVLSIVIILGLLAESQKASAAGLETTILAGGCFWCVESDFESVPGVTKAVSGYTGGSLVNPTYKQVSKGGTGHYEAVEITYDSGKISYEQILHLFMRSVDPTDAGGQFCDRGESYRTAIFVKNDAERDLAEAAIAEARAKLGKSIATPVLNAAPFYPAEDVHQNYYKGKELVLTRYGPRSRASAYKLYRKACGRDARVKTLWGTEAPFADH